MLVVHGSIIHPQFAGEITVKALGVDLAIFDPEGKELLNGEAGEMVIRRPFPNMALKFWNDSDGSRYRSSYFDLFPGIFVLTNERDSQSD